MVANMRRVVFVSLAMVAMVLVYAARQAAPTSYVVSNYSFEDSTVSPAVPDGGMTAYPVGQTPPSVGQLCNPPATAFPARTVMAACRTAAGSQCSVNPSTSSSKSDINFTVTTNATLMANTRYTMTAAIGSALTATIMNGQSIGFYEATAKKLLSYHGDMYPNGVTGTISRTGGVSETSRIRSPQVDHIPLKSAAGDGIGLFSSRCRHPPGQRPLYLAKLVPDVQFGQLQLERLEMVHHVWQRLYRVLGSRGRTLFSKGYDRGHGERFQPGHGQFAELQY